MKIVAISDGHGNLPDIPECDVFIHAGDICPATNHTRSFQSNWLKDKFVPWLDNIPAKEKIIIAGNHDWIFYDAKNLLPRLNCHYLENSSIEIDGRLFYGTPWTPWFLDWAFNFPKSEQTGECPKTKAMWALIPDATDILITHGPPHGKGDNVQYTERVGCPELLLRVLEIKPKLHIFGHIHSEVIEGRQSIISDNDQQTIFCNVSIVNERYIMKWEPTIIEI